jgi:xanthine/CO dehydrogenase XdhC/CoxF family maturation factor
MSQHPAGMGAPNPAQVQQMQQYIQQQRMLQMQQLQQQQAHQLAAAAAAGSAPRIQVNGPSQPGQPVVVQQQQIPPPVRVPSAGSPAISPGSSAGLVSHFSKHTLALALIHTHKHPCEIIMSSKSAVFRC